jgi:hypothetical protein
MLKSPVTDMEEDSTNEIESIINHLRQGYPISSVEADAKQERSPFKVSPVVSPIPAIAIHQIENINRQLTAGMELGEIELPSPKELAQFVEDLLQVVRSQPFNPTDEYKHLFNETYLMLFRLGSILIGDEGQKEQMLKLCSHREQLVENCMLRIENSQGQLQTVTLITALRNTDQPADHPVEDYASCARFEMQSIVEALRNNQPSVIDDVSAIKMYVQKLLLCKEDYESSQKLCGHSLLETNDNLTVEKITKDWDEAYRLIWDNVQIVQPFIGDSMMNAIYQHWNVELNELLNNALLIARQPRQRSQDSAKQVIKLTNQTEARIVFMLGQVYNTQRSSSSHCGFSVPNKPIISMKILSVDMNQVDRIDYIMRDHTDVFEIQKDLKQNQGWGADFTNVRIENINRLQRPGVENVSEEIYHFEYSLQLWTVQGGFVISSRSYPISITVHASQQPKSVGKLIWHNRFGKKMSITGNVHL